MTRDGTRSTGQSGSPSVILLGQAFWTRSLPDGPEAGLGFLTDPDGSGPLYTGSFRNSLPWRSAHVGSPVGVRHHFVSWPMRRRSLAARSYGLPSDS